MATAKLLGAWGEALAAEFLRKKHYKILASGYRSRFGEIDLIVKDRKTLVFVEVKLRKSDAYAKARDYVDKRKQEKHEKKLARKERAKQTKSNRE